MSRKSNYRGGAGMSCIMSDELKTLSRRIALLEDRLHKVEIDRRATAKPSKTSKGSAVPIRVFECRHCSADPCVLRVDAAAVVPTHCPYCIREANWQELRPAAKKPKTDTEIIVGS